MQQLMKRFGREQKILMLSSSVVCLSFTILDVLKKRKGIIKILVYSYSSVILMILYIYTYYTIYI